MKIDTKELQTRLARLSGVVSAGAMMPVLATVHINGNRIRATNLDQEAVVTVEGSGEPVNLCVPFRRLLAVVRSIESPTVTLTQSKGAGTRLYVEGGASKFTLLGMPEDEFPAANDVSGTPVRMPAESVLMGLESVFRSASEDASRPALQSVFMAISGRSCAFVATDGRRLSKWGDIDKPERTTILPYAAARTLRDILGEYGDVEIVADERAVRFTLTGNDGTCVFRSKLVEGQYPSYRQVIPTTECKAFTCAREPLRNAIRRVNIIGEKEDAVQLCFGEESISLSKKHLDGDGFDVVALTEGSGDSECISSNPRYLLDALDSIREESVTIRYRSDTDPLEFVGGENYHLVMPVRVT